MCIIRVHPGPTDVEPRHHRTDTPCGRGVDPITVPDSGLSLPPPDCHLPGIGSTPRCVETLCRTTFSESHALTHYSPTRLPIRSCPPTAPRHRCAWHTSPATSPGPPHPRARPDRRIGSPLPFRKRPLPLCLIISTTLPTRTGSTAPYAAAPIPTCSSPPMVNAAMSVPGVSAPPNRSAKTVPYSPTAALTPSPPPSLMASGVACPRPSAPATPGAPAARPDPASVSRRRTL